MKLSDVLKALAFNTKVSITLEDSDETELITFNATGYKAVESELGKKNVKKIKIISATAATVVLDEDEEETESTTDPVTPDPTDPTNPTDPTGGD